MESVETLIPDNEGNHLVVGHWEGYPVSFFSLLSNPMKMIIFAKNESCIFIHIFIVRYIGANIMQYA